MTLALLTFVSDFLLIVSGGLFMLNREVLLNRLTTVVSSRTARTLAWALSRTCCRRPRPARSETRLADPSHRGTGKEMGPWSASITSLSVIWLAGRARRKPPRKPLRDRIKPLRTSFWKILERKVSEMEVARETSRSIVERSLPARARTISPSIPYSAVRFSRKTAPLALPLTVNVVGS